MLSSLKVLIKIMRKLVKTKLSKYKFLKLLILGFLMIKLYKKNLWLKNGKKWNFNYLINNKS